MTIKSKKNTIGHNTEIKQYGINFYNNMTCDYRNCNKNDFFKLNYFCVINLYHHIVTMLKGFCK